MSKIYLIIAREYRAKVANRSFLLTTIMVPVVSIIMTLMSAVLSGLEPDQPLLSLSESESSQMVGIAIALVIYLSILLFGVQIMRSVMEEKQSRVVEILSGSISPFLLVTGKIIAITLLSITQITLWLLLTKVGFKLLPTSYSWAIEWYPFTTLVQIKLFIFATLFYLGGFLLYCSLFAIIGVIATPNTDTNIWMLPLTIPIIFSIYVMLSPEAFSPALVCFTEFFPFTSPIVLSSKIATGMGWLPLSLSLLLLWGTTAIVIWISSRIYQSALLLYHNKISWSDIRGWLTKKNRCP